MSANQFRNNDRKVNGNRDGQQRLLFRNNSPRLNATGLSQASPSNSLNNSLNHSLNNSLNHSLNRSLNPNRSLNNGYPSDAFMSNFHHSLAALNALDSAKAQNSQTIQGTSRLSNLNQTPKLVSTSQQSRQMSGPRDATARSPANRHSNPLNLIDSRAISELSTDHLLSLINLTNQHPSSSQNSLASSLNSPPPPAANRSSSSLLNRSNARASPSSISNLNLLNELCGSLSQIKKLKQPNPPNKFLQTNKQMTSNLLNLLELPDFGLGNLPSLNDNVNDNLSHLPDLSLGLSDLRNNFGGAQLAGNNLSLNSLNSLASINNLNNISNLSLDGLNNLNNSLNNLSSLGAANNLIRGTTDNRKPQTVTKPATGQMRSQGQIRQPGLMNAGRPPNNKARAPIGSIKPTSSATAVARPVQPTANVQQHRMPPVRRLYPHPQKHPQQHLPQQHARLQQPVQQQQPKSSTVVVCDVCGESLRSLEEFDAHEQARHPNVVCSFSETDTPNVKTNHVQSKSDLKQLFIPIEKVNSDHPKEGQPQEEAGFHCTKCQMKFGDVNLFHEHILDCAETKSETPPVPKATDTTSDDRKPVKLSINGKPVGRPPKHRRVINSDLFAKRVVYPKEQPAEKKLELPEKPSERPADEAGEADKPAELSNESTSQPKRVEPLRIQLPKKRKLIASSLLVAKQKPNSKRFRMNLSSASMQDRINLRNSLFHQYKSVSLLNNHDQSDGAATANASEQSERPPSDRSPIKLARRIPSHRFKCSKCDRKFRLPTKYRKHLKNCTGLPKVETASSKPIRRPSAASTPTVQKNLRERTTRSSLRNSLRQRSANGHPDDRKLDNEQKPVVEAAAEPQEPQESQPTIAISEDKPTAPNKIPNIRIKLRPPSVSSKKPLNLKPISLILKKASTEQENINVDQPKKLIKQVGSSLLMISGHSKSKFNRSGSSILKISTKSPSAIQSSSVQSLLSQNTHTEQQTSPPPTEDPIDVEPKEEPKDDLKVEHAEEQKAQQKEEEQEQKVEQVVEQKAELKVEEQPKAESKDSPPEQNASPSSKESKESLIRRSQRISKKYATQAKQKATRERNKRLNSNQKAHGELNKPDAKLSGKYRGLQMRQRTPKSPSTVPELYTNHKCSKCLSLFNDATVFEKHIATCNGEQSKRIALRSANGTPVKPSRSSSRTSSRSVSPGKSLNEESKRRLDDECQILKNDDIMNAVAALSSFSEFTNKTRASETANSETNDRPTDVKPTIKFGPKIVLNKKSKGSSLLSSSGNSLLSGRMTAVKTDEDASETKVESPAGAIASVTNVIRNKFISLLKK